MRWVINIYKKYKRRMVARRVALRSRLLITRTMVNLGLEAYETKEMARVFFRLLGKKLGLKDRSVPPTEQEINEAIEQLVDVGRFSVFSIISLFPGGAISLIALELMARKFGVKGFTLIPSSFRKAERRKKLKEYRKKLSKIIDQKKTGTLGKIITERKQLLETYKPDLMKTR